MLNQSDGAVKTTVSMAASLLHTKERLRFDLFLFLSPDLHYFQMGKSTPVSPPFAAPVLKWCQTRYERLAVLARLGAACRN